MYRSAKQPCSTERDCWAENIVSLRGIKLKRSPHILSGELNTYKKMHGGGAIGLWRTVLIFLIAFAIVNTHSLFMPTAIFPTEYLGVSYY